MISRIISFILSIIIAVVSVLLLAPSFIVPIHASASDLRPDWDSQDWAEYYVGTWSSLIDVAKGGVEGNPSDVVLGTIGAAVQYAGYLGSLAESYVDVNNAVSVSGSVLIYPTSGSSYITPFNLSYVHQFSIPSSSGVVQVYDSAPFNVYLDTSSVSSSTILYFNSTSTYLNFTRSSISPSTPQIFSNAGTNAGTRLPFDGIRISLSSSPLPNQKLSFQYVASPFHFYTTSSNELGALSTAVLGSSVNSSLPSSVTFPRTVLPSFNSFMYNDPSGFYSELNTWLLEEYPDDSQRIGEIMDIIESPLYDEEPTEPETHPSGCQCDVHVTVEFPTSDFHFPDYPSENPDFVLPSDLPLETLPDISEPEIPEGILEKASSSVSFWFEIFDTIVDGFNIRWLIGVMLFIGILFYFIVR